MLHNLMDKSVMEDPMHSSQVAPPWTGQLFGVLTGWLVFLFAVFLLLIGSSVALKYFGIVVKTGEAMFFVEVVAAAVISAFLAVGSGRAATNWIKSQSVLTIYLCLGVAILLVLLSFPSIVTFSTTQNVEAPGIPARP